MMTSLQAITIGGSIASAATVVAASAIEEGVSPATGWSAGMVGGGVAVFLYLEKRANRDRIEQIELRRADDRQHREEARDDRKRIRELEKEIARLYERIVTILTATREAVEDSDT